MRKAIGTFVIAFFIIAVGGCVLSLGGVVSTLKYADDVKVTQNSVLLMKLDGVIIDVDQFLKDLKKYSKMDNIKAVLVQINSPGGAVGPSQELFFEIERVKQELKKPVVVSVSSMAASGGYYAAVAADKIIVAPGAMLGSIGVIINFSNLEKLYDWAKIRRYSVTTGRYKDSGAEYRPMREDEKRLFQNMINEVHVQFKNTVMKGRKLSKDVVDKYSDGRVFTGETAVKLGFADQTGTREDALRLAWELAGLEGEPKTFIPPKKRPDLTELLVEMKSPVVDTVIDDFLKNMKMSAQPLYLMPGVL